MIPAPAGAELLKLTWDQVDLERGSLTFLDTKNSEDRVVPLGQQALKTIQMNLNRTPGGLSSSEQTANPLRISVAVVESA